MGIKKTILKNISALFGAQLITSVLNPLLLILIARKLGDEIFGKYSLLLSLTAIFLIVSDFGIKAVAIRDVARDTSRTDEYLSNIIGLKLFFSSIAILVFIVSVYLLDMPPDTTLASYFFAGGLFFQSMSYAFRWVFHALQVMEKEAVQRVAEKLLLLILSVLVLWSGFGLIALSAAFLVTQLIILLLSLFFASKTIRIAQIRMNLSFCRYLVKTAVFFALIEVLWMIYFRIDIVMLAKIKGETVVGWYNAAYVIVNFITLISMLSMQVFFPVLSHLYRKEKKKLKETSERLFRYLILIALPIVPAVFILSDKIITLLYGSGYPQSISALKILIFVIIFLFPGNLFAHILGSSNRHKTLTLINFTGVVVNVALNFILIPRLSYIGAGLSTIITEIILCLLLYMAVSKFLKIESLRIFLKLSPGYAAMILLVYFGAHFPLIPVVAVAFLVYFFSAYLTGGIKTEDFSLLSEAVPRESNQYFNE